MFLKATSNPAPRAAIADFNTFRAQRRFRALTCCRLSLETDDATGKLTGLRVLEAFQDPGWTPPFRYGEFSPAQTPALFADADLRDPEWYPGEASTLSAVVAQRQCRNTSILDIPSGEEVLANALLKFRAGRHTDQVCIKLGCPFHVPWLWQEWLLTCVGGRFKLYARGSKFPSHAWYVDGRQVLAAAGIGDASFPIVSEAPPAGLGALAKLLPLPPRRRQRINLQRLALYPAVLSQGVPATDRQTPNGPAEQELEGPVDKHPHTTPAWRMSIVPFDLP
jgi:hypothetical protein